MRSGKRQVSWAGLILQSEPVPPDSEQSCPSTWRHKGCGRRVPFYQQGAVLNRKKALGLGLTTYCYCIHRPATSLGFSFSLPGLEIEEPPFNLFKDSSLSPRTTESSEELLHPPSVFPCHQGCELGPHQGSHSLQHLQSGDAHTILSLHLIHL